MFVNQDVATAGRHVDLYTIITVLCTVKAWVHLNWSEGHISGYGGYLEQAMNF